MDLDGMGVVQALVLIYLTLEKIAKSINEMIK